MFEFLVCYPFDGEFDNDDVVEELCKQCDGEVGDSGCGFGTRDLWCQIPESKAPEFIVAASFKNNLQIRSIVRLS